MLPTVRVRGAKRWLPADERELRQRLMLVTGAALVLRLILIAVTEGSGGDIGSFRGVNAALHDDPLGIYAVVNKDENFAWPYPPLYFPVVYGVGELASLTGIDLAKLIRLPQVAADLAIAWLVQWHLGWRGVSPTGRLMAAALILFNPALIAVTGIQGQVDPIQWVPAVAAIIAWERLPRGRRALAAGLLLGVAAAIKTIPGILVLALLPLARDNAERAKLVGASLVVPVLSVLPFFLADPTGTRTFLDYQGIPGQGGLSMILQPDLALMRFGDHPFEGFNGIEQVLQDVVPFLVPAALLAVTVMLFRARPNPAVGASLLILTVFVFGANYVSFYAVWLLPFILLAGWTRFYWVITALALIPLVFRYAPPWFPEAAGIGDVVYDDWAVYGLYVPTAAALWGAYAWRLGSWSLRHGSETAA